jgi:hypothetical protein
VFLSVRRRNHFVMFPESDSVSGMSSEAGRLRLSRAVMAYARMAENYRGQFYPSMRPEPGSRAAKEIEEDGSLAGPWSDGPLSLAYGAAELHLGAAQDQLIGLGMLLQGPVENALMTLARGVVEACARAAWLLDPSLDARSRVARCMTERLHGRAHEAALSAKIGRELGSEGPIAAITASAEQHGIGVSRDGRGGRYLGEEPYPGQTKAVEMLFASYGDNFGVRAYADLSAVAHSSLPAFAFRKPAIVSGDVPPQQKEDPPVERAVIVALVAVDEAVSRYLTLFGWNPTPWKDCVRQTHADLRELISATRGAVDLIRVRR